MLILNDIHIGVQRKGGTTPTSQEALRNYLFTSFEQTLKETTETHLCILGDLFDEFEVFPRDWLQTYQILQDFIVRAAGTLTLVAGNHDHSPKALRVSAFEMLGRVLMEQFGKPQVVVVGIDQFRWIDEDSSIIALAHCSNQDIFNLKLAELLTLLDSGDRVLLHANYNNGFAAESDHSLNVSEEQAKAFVEKGVTLYFAHEHQAREALSGSVVVFGNQWPTSIADCLHNDDKHAHILGDGIAQVETWSRAGSNGYIEVPWQELDGDLPAHSFLKVTGDATSNQAADVINAIAKHRAKSDAFVVSNGVKIDGIVATDALPEAFEAAKAFDVMEFIRGELTLEEMVTVEGLL